MKKIFLTFITFAFFFSFSSSILAQARVESDHFRVQFPNLNSGAGLPTSENYRVNATLGQNAVGVFESDGYSVRSGFQYVHTIIPFSFTVSDILINFGSITPGVPATKQSTLTVKAGGAGGYSVKAQSSHPLQNESGSAAIPNTRCDFDDCTFTSASEWTDNQKYGFGFNISGDDIASDFINSTYFRPFADASSSERASVIMSKNQVTYNYPNNAWPWESEAIVTYKVNLSPTQIAGTYRNVVIYTAIPSF